MSRYMKVSAIGLAVCAAGLVGASFSSSAFADAQYQQDVARCNSGQTAEGRATCLKEAGASQVERARGGLTDPSNPQANAMARCNALPTGQREDCMALMSGQGQTTTEGSVAGGGVLRETVIPVPPGTPGSYPSAPSSYTPPAGGYASPPGSYAPPAGGYAEPPAQMPPPAYGPAGTPRY